MEVGKPESVLVFDKWAEDKTPVLYFAHGHGSKPQPGTVLDVRPAEVRILANAPQEVHGVRLTGCEFEYGDAAENGALNVSPRSKLGAYLAIYSQGKQMIIVEVNQ
ncbi:MAG: hypothetical protein H0X25_15630 [Acidobacteriales bacterium]|nr:hypothetical protein [Terriglobales bacterium]